jgi:hypothetical protein
VVNLLLSFALAGVTALAADAEEQPQLRIQPGMEVYYPGGKAPARTYKSIFGLGQGSSWYVFTGKTLCEAQTVSSERPSAAGNGWRLDLKPGAAGSNAMQVTWERLWVGGKPSSGGGTRTLTLGSGSPLVLDSIDGGARLLRKETIERLKGVSVNDLRTLIAVEDIDGVTNGRTKAIDARLSELERHRRELIEVQRLGAANTQVIRVDNEMADNRRALQQELASNVATVLTTLQNNTQLTAVDGCDALSMNLRITTETMDVMQPTETEIWLVHRDAAGVEKVQRQVVRSANGNGSFVFDDVVVQTGRGPITVEVFGNVGVVSRAGDGGQPWLGLDVNRRYVTTASAVGWKTKEGGTKFYQSIRPDEVVAFQLQPLKDDEGALVGHRFSVRVRTKILK